MGFSQLIAELNTLKTYFTGKKTEIDNAVAAALAAVPSTQRTAYVDAVDGLDTAAGTAAAPYKTINKALQLCKPGAWVTVFLRCGQTHVLTSGQSIYNMLLRFDRYGAGANPIFTVVVTETAEANFVQQIGVEKSTVHFLNVEPLVPNKLNAAKPWGGALGLFAAYTSVSFGGSTFKVSGTDATPLKVRVLPDVGVVRQGVGGFSTVSLQGVELINEAGTGTARPVVNMGDSALALDVGNIVFGAGTKLVDVVTSRADGIKNITTNYAGVNLS